MRLVRGAALDVWCSLAGWERWLLVAAGRTPETVTLGDIRNLRRDGR